MIASWPIPNIAEVLRRIGSRKPKIFGIMDLTQGYHQAPLSDTTKAYTAFFLGTVNYLRDFVRNHSTIVKPLQDLIANYDKTRKIVWTPETTAAFTK